MAQSFLSLTTSDLSPVIDVLASHIADSSHILLRGDLGAGKTTLVALLMEKLGSSDIVSSPTYSIVNEYKTPDVTIYHMDLYRLETAEELLAIGFEDYLYNGICIIEWPEIAADYDFDQYVSVEIKKEGNSRVYVVE